MKKKEYSILKNGQIMSKVNPDQNCQICNLDHEN